MHNDDSVDEGDFEQREREEMADNMIVRIYDARYKIPAVSDAGQMITGRASRANGPSMGNQAYRNIVKFVERFKKFSSSTIVVLMGIACVLTLIVYIY
jgi:hypothetical protein